jgi:hypothetical protein
MSDNTWLGMQTATRFRNQLAVAGPVVKLWKIRRSILLLSEAPSGRMSRTPVSS